MDSDGGVPLSMDQPPGRRQRLRSYRRLAEESDSSDGELVANLSRSQAQYARRRSTHIPSEGSSRRTNVSSHPLHSPFGISRSGPSTLDAELANPAGSLPSHSRASGRSFSVHNRRRADSTSAICSPSRADAGLVQVGVGDENCPPRQLPVRVSNLEDEQSENSMPNTSPFPRGIVSPRLVLPTRIGSSSARGHPPSLFMDPDVEDWENYAESDGGLANMAARISPRIGRASQPITMDDSVIGTIQTMPGALKRSRDKFENVDGKDISKKLDHRGAVAVVLYRSGVPDPEANDVWPNFRSSAKQPARYYLLDKNNKGSQNNGARRRPAKMPKMNREIGEPIEPVHEEHIQFRGSRSEWKLPVELVELIASHLNRDDVKAMRLVSRELNHYISQVVFKTVVVPFNTEIYGMLGQEPKPDRKGKKKVKSSASSFTWKNANGDDVYNGHGLDVFRGFGRHILKYGMSFEVNEDALAKPPEKHLTGRHSSFWGSYDWPFEEYCRFDDVAGLETAADETPRMKIAFSELSKVQELALSIDSGLGWLNGPDRSIRARILQQPPEVFGNVKHIPDRRMQAQRELWEYVESCHEAASSDIKLAMLYKLDANRPLSELQEANMAVTDRAEMPFLGPHIIQQAIAHETAEVQVPTSFDDPEVLDRFVSIPSPSGAGILFSSTIQPTDAGHIMSPIIPANLTKAQKEWLLETEWAQRAFLSSYMLSVIDNHITFCPVHTLNISRLSDRYLSTLNRLDFWDSLPNLRNVTLMVIPSWRTVNKDEAGFVETPKINPSGAIDPFYGLLSRIMSHRQNIKKLSIGWTTGGEHAEGMHARNKLILPAPVMSADMSCNQNTESLSSALLQLPFIEHLTLKNCWITPPALLQLIRLHDRLSLKHITLDSVSTTAILRPHQHNHGNQVNPPAAGMLAMQALAQLQQPPGLQPNTHATQNVLNPGQILQFHIHALQQHIQQIQAHANAGLFGHQIAALQAQLQNQIQLQQQQLTQNQAHNTTQQTQIQAQIHPLTNLFVQASNIQQQQQQAALPPVPVPQPAPDARSALMGQPREGSWMNLIDIMTPGANLSDFGSEFSQADAERTTSLQSIEFISCGYARLHHSNFDQSALEAINGIAGNSTRNSFFTKRFNALAPAMLGAKWALLGEILQVVDNDELAALNAGWHLETGWKDSEEAKAVEFDGLLPGGTGRFSGVVRAEDRVAEASANVRTCTMLMSQLDVGF